VPAVLTSSVTCNVYSHLLACVKIAHAFATHNAADNQFSGDKYNLNMNKRLPIINDFVFVM